MVSLLFEHGILFLIIVFLFFQQRRKNKKREKELLGQVEHYQKLRADERAGRTKAERNLRDLLASKKSGQQKKETEEQVIEEREEGIFVKPIGHIESCYPTRTGIPKQGTLAPSTRALLVLSTDVGEAAIEGIEEFDYLWISFIFHQNTNTKALLSAKSPQGEEEGKEKKGKGGGRFPFVKSKIRPPRLQGRSVGVLSTRSPHRFNSIGLTLAKLVKVSSYPAKKGSKERNKKGALFLSGIDLMNGTPVIDIKPYISLYDSIETAQAPPWVCDFSTNSSFSVSFADVASRSLREIVEKGELRFYGGKAGKLWRERGKKEGEEDEKSLGYEVDMVKRAIEDIVQMDIRSLSQKRKNSSKREEDEREGQKYSMRFDNLKVEIQYRLLGDGCSISHITLEGEEEKKKEKGD